MQSVILLTLVVIIGFLFKKEKNNHARMIIGAVFGIAFFSIWPFTVYYVEIHQLNKNYLIASYTIISILAILLSLLLVRIQQELTVAIIALFLFFSTTIFTMSFESEIKNKISIYTGYFNENYFAKRSVNNLQDLEQRKIASLHNYTLSLHNNWQKKTEKGPLFEYYLLYKDAKIIAELRPKCFSTGKISLPEIVTNIKSFVKPSGMETKENCYQINKTSYACKTIIFNKENQTKRIRWHSLNTDTTQGIELDFVIFNNGASTLKEIDQIINSAKILEKNKKSYDCLGLTEWM